MKRDAPAATIDAYLACVPEQQRRTLEKLRKTIRSAAPEAVETISYMIPAFRLNGMLVGFGAFKKHNSFFVMSSKLMAGELAADLEGYDTSKGGIRGGLAATLGVDILMLGAPHRRTLAAILKGNVVMSVARNLPESKRRFQIRAWAQASVARIRPSDGGRRRDFRVEFTFHLSWIRGLAPRAAGDPRCSSRGSFIRLARS